MNTETLCNEVLTQSLEDGSITSETRCFDRPLPYPDIGWYILAGIWILLAGVTLAGITVL